MFGYSHFVLLLIQVGFQGIAATPTSRQELSEKLNSFPYENLDKEKISLNQNLVEHTTFPSFVHEDKNLQHDDLDPKCFYKTVELTEVVYDEKLVCETVTYQNCFTALKTVYKPKNITNCMSNFRKECHTVYVDETRTETVRICKSTPEKHCNDQDTENCEILEQTVCQTTFSLYNLTDNENDCVTKEETHCRDDPSGGEPICSKVPRRQCKFHHKTVPSTECVKVPHEVCGPSDCPVQVSKTCDDVERTLVIQVPKNRCSLQPFPACTDEVVNYPTLEEQTECVDAPKSICNIAKVNPREETRLVTKKLCTADLPTTQEPPTITEAGFTTEVNQVNKVDNNSETTLTPF